MPIALSETEQAVRSAASALHAGDTGEAERLVRTALALDRRNPQGLLLLAVIEHQRQRDGAALVLLEEAAALEPASCDTHALQGHVLRRLDRHEDALAAWDRALRLRPDRADVLFNRGNLLRELGRNEEALASYERALAVAPGDPDILNNHAVALQLLGRHEESLERLARVLALAPNDVAALDNRGIALHAMGRHALALEAFEAALAADPAHVAALVHRGHALQALDRLDEALASQEAALRVAPDDADACQSRGAVLLELSRPVEALDTCERALRLRPGFVEALTTRGQALLALDRYAEALESYRAAQVQHATPEGALGMGDALQALGRPAEAVACFDEALALRPAYAEALNNRGNALQALNRHEEALASYARARELRPHDAQAHWNEGLALLAIGELKDGFQKYEWRWHNRKLALPPRADPARAWQGEPIGGRSILLYPEQGFGDAIQFVRYAPRVAALGARVSLVCHAWLHELFATLPGVERVYTAGAALPAFDLNAPLMSLPLAFGTELATIPADVPYLAANAAEVARWRERLAVLPGARKVGLVWTGNPQFPGARTKSCPVALLAPLLQAQDVGWVSLQTGAGAGQAAALAVTDWTAELTSFARTAALVSALDLVITIDTAVAHLAGALGKPVWILLPFAADWRWLREREDCPWYPSARLFRQPRIGDWEAVVARVTNELARL